MIPLKWQNICVLVVDDNSFMRELLVATLRSLGIAQAVAVPDCATAIERLKLSRTDPVAAGLGTVDLIMADYLMPGVDGILFLRWLRSDKQVPDRFVPFIMVSGAADQYVVEEARDAGVTEFLAKPYSVKSVADRILGVINAPRQFVLAPGYFDPDRRRSATAVSRERRDSSKDNIQTVSPDSKISALREDVRAIHFLPGNKLRQKLGVGPHTGPADFDPLVIRAAEERIQALVGDYADWVKKYLAQMNESLEALEEMGGIGDATPRLLATINRIAHELRGQSGTFDYPLITSFAKSLYQVTREHDGQVGVNRRRLIAAHIDAIRTVFHNRITGDGGDVGRDLMAEIAAAVKKYR